MQTDLTYAEIQEAIAPLEGYARVSLGPETHAEFASAAGGGLVVRVPEDPTDAETDRTEYVITRELWAGLAKDLGAGGRYFDQTPPRLLLPQINWWYNDSGRSQVDLLARRAPDGRNIGLDILKPGRHPVSASRLIDLVHGFVSDQGGEPQYAWFNREGLRECTVALVQPRSQHEVTASRQPGDILERGVLVQFSPIGAVPVTVRTYVNRLICTNGMTSTESMDAWTAPGGDGQNDVYEWLPAALSEAWDYSDSLFSAADRMAAQEVPEDAIETITEDLFNAFRTPVSLRAAVMRQLAAQNVENTWDIANAITYAATHDPALKNINHRIRLMALGGDAPAHMERCPECNHLVGR